MDVTEQRWSEDFTETTAPLHPMERAGMELHRLNRYVFMLAIFALCALLSTWSRIDLRETSLALDEARTRYTAAEAEQARLRLELATLSDPAWLSQAASSLSLEGSATVIDIPADAQR